MITIQITDEDLHSGRHPLTSAMSRAGVQAPHASTFMVSYLSREGLVLTTLIPPAGQQLSADYEEGKAMQPLTLELDVDPADLKPGA